MSRLRWHATETNDYPGLPQIAERHRVARASYLRRQPNTREAERLCPGADGGAGCRDAAVDRADGNEGCPGRGGGPGWTGMRGARDAAGWPGEMRPYRLPRHGAMRLPELLSGVREDHPKVVLE